MKYKLKYINLSDEQMNRIAAMHIPNTDDGIDNESWEKNALAIMESEIEAAEEALSIYLK